MIDLNKNLLKQVEILIHRYPILKEIKDSFIEAYYVMEACFKNSGKLLIAGNGGSAADSEHIAGELMKRFQRARPVSNTFAERLKKIDPIRGAVLADKLECSLMAIPLVANEALTTACINDVDAESMFAQQLFGYGRKGDVFLGISTSGNSKNVLNAAIVAHAVGIKVIGLTGADGGELSKISDVVIKVPEKETYRIQELHLPVYHSWCLMLEETFFGRQEEE
jgi:D-sedoheptulose 7-phosphate isomerase